MERQYIVFIAAAAAAFAALIALAYYNPFQQSEGGDSDVIKVRKGEEASIRYSSTTVSRIQDLPNRNRVDVEVSSELHNTNFAGLRGEVRYSDMTITYVRHGEIETVSDDDFSSIEYRFLPDAGNKTTYAYEDVDFIASSTDAQLVVSVMPLTTAEVGEQYTIRLYLRTGGAVDYAIAEKVIEIVP